MILDAGFLVSVDRGERAAQEFLAAAVRYETPYLGEPVLTGDVGDLEALTAAIPAPHIRVVAWP